jgi:hypothetical protein
MKLIDEKESKQSFIDFCDRPVSGYIQAKNLHKKMPSFKCNDKSFMTEVNISKDFHLTYLMMNSIHKIPINDFCLITSKTHTAETYQ